MTEKSVQRRLTTILAADVAGYSKLVAENEEETFHMLKSYRELIDRFIVRHEGRVFGSAGDSVVAEFGSAVEAVRCAMVIQEELRVRNAEIAEERRMLFRIGVNVGDVLVDDGNLLGDGVNIAARLEGLAHPGGICISGSTFEQVKNRLSIGFEDIGPQTVKNIPQPVLTYRLVPGSVSVAPAGFEKNAKGRWRVPAILLGVVLIATVAVAFGFYREYLATWAGGETPVARAYVGKSLNGISPISGRQWTMHLNDHGKAEVKLSPREGVEIFDSGSWWIDENNRICVEFSFFINGTLVCRKMVTEGGVTKALGFNEQTHWIFQK